MADETRDQTGTAHRGAERKTPRELLGLTEQRFQAIGQAGVTFYRQGQLEKARKIFEGLVRLDPDSGATHAALGALYTRMRQYDEALKHLNRAIELSPTQVAPYVNRAEIMIRQQRIELAVADLKQAMALDPAGASPVAGRARAMALGIQRALEAQRAETG